MPQRGLFCLSGRVIFTRYFHTWLDDISYLETAVELAVLRVVRLGAQLVHAGEERYPQVVGQPLSEVCLLYTSPSPRD